MRAGGGTEDGGVGGTGDSTVLRNASRAESPSKRHRQRRTCCGLDVSGPLMNPKPRHGFGYRPTVIEDIANVFTHALCIVPSLVMGYWLIVVSKSYTQAVVASLYTGALMLLFSLSSLHHLLSLVGLHRTRIGALAHYGDRVGIYIFIAASYTPWLALRNFHIDPSFVLYMIWTAAIAGIVYQALFHEKYANVEVVIYITLGLGPSLFIACSVCFNGWFELALGGATYISGVLFFKLDGVVPFAHAVWHIFVIVGALIHYWAISHHLYLNPSLCDPSVPPPVQLIHALWGALSAGLVNQTQS